MENKIRAAKDFAKELVRNETPRMRWNGTEDPVRRQTESREKLASLLGMDRFEPCPLNVQVEFERQWSGHTETRFTFESEAGWTVPCHMLTPNGTPKGVMICLQGHSTGMHNSLNRRLYDGDEDAQSGDRGFAVQAADRGYIAVALEQRAFGECGGTPRPDCYHAAMMSLMVGRTLLGQRIWDVKRAIETLKTHFGFACLPYYCMGNSGGGTATVYAAALLEELAGAMPSCSVCTWEKSIANTVHCACNYVPGIARYFDMGDIAALIAPRPYVQVNGKDDEIFLLDGAKDAFNGAKRVYEALGAADKCRLVVGGGGHRFYAADAWPVFEELTMNN